MKRTIIAAFLAASAGAAYAISPMWVSDVRLSPDGSKVAFVYKGDIYTVASSGGQAARLTDGTAVEANPVWSPDGKRIAFASDRNGGEDVYIMNADGSGQKRLTFNSAPQVPHSFTRDGKSVIFAAAIEDPAQSALAPVKTTPELYSVPADGGRYSQVLAVPVGNMRNVPGSEKIVYEYIKGGEDKWRKPHTSSVARDIWTYDASTGKYTNLTSH
ncbi:MAG: DPP IV N-terminal domain-containing protein, partial [Muribaculaceae bacterium]|nr:DPP IV N-terminal domain-containing protein [Muribaculaceae bacterium]